MPPVVSCSCLHSSLPPIHFHQHTWLSGWGFMSYHHPWAPLTCTGEQFILFCHLQTLGVLPSVPSLHVKSSTCIGFPWSCTHGVLGLPCPSSSCMLAVAACVPPVSCSTAPVTTNTSCMGKVWSWGSLHPLPLEWMVHVSLSKWSLKLVTQHKLSPISSP